MSQPRPESGPAPKRGPLGHDELADMANEPPHKMQCIQNNDGGLHMQQVDVTKPARPACALLEASSWLQLGDVECQGRPAKLMGGHGAAAHMLYVQCQCQECETVPESLQPVPGLMTLEQYCQHATGVNLAEYSDPACNSFCRVHVVACQDGNKVPLGQYLRSLALPQLESDLIGRQLQLFWHDEPPGSKKGTWFTTVVLDVDMESAEVKVQYRNGSVSSVFLGANFVHFGPFPPAPGEKPQLLPASAGAHPHSGADRELSVKEEGLKSHGDSPLASPTYSPGCRNVNGDGVDEVRETLHSPISSSRGSKGSGCDSGDRVLAKPGTVLSPTQSLRESMPVDEPADGLADTIELKQDGLRVPTDKEETEGENQAIAVCTQEGTSERHCAERTLRNNDASAEAVSSAAAASNAVQNGREGSVQQVGKGKRKLRELLESFRDKELAVECDPVQKEDANIDEPNGKRAQMDPSPSAVFKPPGLVDQSTPGPVPSTSHPSLSQPLDSPEGPECSMSPRVPRPDAPTSLHPSPVEQACRQHHDKQDPASTSGGREQQALDEQEAVGPNHGGRYPFPTNTGREEAITGKGEASGQGCDKGHDTAAGGEREGADVEMFEVSGWWHGRKQAASPSAEREEKELGKAETSGQRHGKRHLDVASGVREEGDVGKNETTDQGHGKRHLSVASGVREEGDVGKNETTEQGRGRGHHTATRNEGKDADAHEDEAPGQSRGREIHSAVGGGREEAGRDEHLDAERTGMISTGGIDLEQDVHEDAGNSDKKVANHQIASRLASSPPHDDEPADEGFETPAAQHIARQLVLDLNMPAGDVLTGFTMTAQPMGATSLSSTGLERTLLAPSQPSTSTSMLLNVNNSPPGSPPGPVNQDQARHHLYADRLLWPPHTAPDAEVVELASDSEVELVDREDVESWEVHDDDSSDEVSIPGFLTSSHKTPIVDSSPEDLSWFLLLTPLQYLAFSAKARPTPTSGLPLSEVTQNQHDPLTMTQPLHSAGGKGLDMGDVLNGASIIGSATSPPASMPSPSTLSMHIRGGPLARALNPSALPKANSNPIHGLPSVANPQAKGHATPVGKQPGPLHIPIRHLSIKTEAADSPNSLSWLTPSVAMLLSALHVTPGVILQVPKHLLPELLDKLRNAAEVYQRTGSEDILHSLRQAVMRLLAATQRAQTVDAARKNVSVRQKSNKQNTKMQPSISEQQLSQDQQPNEELMVLEETELAEAASHLGQHPGLRLQTMNAAGPEQQDGSANMPRISITFPTSQPPSSSSMEPGSSRPPTHPAASGTHRSGNNPHVFRRLAESPSNSGTDLSTRTNLPTNKQQQPPQPQQQQQKTPSPSDPCTSGAKPATSQAGGFDKADTGCETAAEQPAASVPMHCMDAEDGEFLGMYEPSTLSENACRGISGSFPINSHRPPPKERGPTPARSKEKEKGQERASPQTYAPQQISNPKASKQARSPLSTPGKQGKGATERKSGEAGKRQSNSTLKEGTPARAADAQMGSAPTNTTRATARSLDRDMATPLERQGISHDHLLSNASGALPRSLKSLQSLLVSRSADHAALLSDPGALNALRMLMPSMGKDKNVQGGQFAGSGLRPRGALRDVDGCNPSILGSRQSPPGHAMTDHGPPGHPAAMQADHMAGVSARVNSRMDGRAENRPDGRRDGSRVDNRMHNRPDCRQDISMDSRMVMGLESRMHSRMDNLMDPRMENRMHMETDNRLDGRMGSRLDNRDSRQDGRQDSRMDCRLDNRMHSMMDSGMDNRFDNRIVNRYDNRMDDVMDNRMEPRMDSRTDNRMESMPDSRVEGRGHNMLGMKGFSGSRSFSAAALNHPSLLRMHKQRLEGGMDPNSPPHSNSTAHFTVGNPTPSFFSAAHPDSSMKYTGGLMEAAPGRMSTKTRQDMHGVAGGQGRASVHSELTAMDMQHSSILSGIQRNAMTMPHQHPDQNAPVRIIGHNMSPMGSEAMMAMSQAMSQSSRAMAAVHQEAAASERRFQELPVLPDTSDLAEIAKAVVLVLNNLDAPREVRKLVLAKLRHMSGDERIIMYVDLRDACSRNDYDSVKDVINELAQGN